MTFVFGGGSSCRNLELFILMYLTILWIEMEHDVVYASLRQRPKYCPLSLKQTSSKRRCSSHSSFTEYKRTYLLPSLSSFASYNSFKQYLGVACGEENSSSPSPEVLDASADQRTCICLEKVMMHYPIGSMHGLFTYISSKMATFKWTCR